MLARSLARRVEDIELVSTRASLLPFAEHVFFLTRRRREGYRPS